jgi:23S rRNA U2552 (ribose-2'-O)-methylase RlmE/FtsJ
MSHLRNYFENNDKRLINKFNHYFDAYERHFSKFRGKKVTIVEIGVFQGGSLQMWRDYFGPDATIWGIDIDPNCKTLEEKDTHILIGSQEDPEFLNSIVAKIGPIDLLIDDGGHTQNQQIVTLDVLFNHIKEDGVFLCEDVHTSYMNVYGGGNLRQGTFIEYSKLLIDKINAHHSEEASLVVDEFTRTANSIHFYDSIVVIEKAKMIPPSSKMMGQRSFPYLPEKKTFTEKVTLHALVHINKLLRKFKVKGFCVNKMMELNCKL